MLQQLRETHTPYAPSPCIWGHTQLLPCPTPSLAHSSVNPACSQEAETQGVCRLWAVELSMGAGWGEAEASRTPRGSRSCCLIHTATWGALCGPGGSGPHVAALPRWAATRTSLKLPGHQEKRLPTRPSRGGASLLEEAAFCMVIITGPF